jgi:small GTP-binding protein
MSSPAADASVGREEASGDEARECTLDEACRLVERIQAQADKGAVAEDDSVWLRVQARLEEKARPRVQARLEEKARLEEQARLRVQARLEEQDALKARLKELEELDRQDCFSFSKLIWLRNNYSPEQLIEAAASHDKREKLLHLWEMQHKDLNDALKRREKFSLYCRDLSKQFERYENREHPAVEEAHRVLQDKKRQNRKIDVDTFFHRIGDQWDVDVPPTSGKGWEQWDEASDGRGKAPAMLPVGCPLSAQEGKDLLDIFAEPELRTLPCASCPSKSRSEEPTRILLVGKTCRGKSSLINALAGSSLHTSIGGRTTKEIVSLEGEWQTLEGEIIRFSIVDTPGVADSDFDDDNTLRDLDKHLLKQTSANLVLFVSNENGADDNDVIAHLQKYSDIFGEQVLQRNFAVIIKKWETDRTSKMKRERSAKQMGASRRATQADYVRLKFRPFYDIFSGHAVVSKFFFVDDMPLMETGACRATHEALDALMRHARDLEPVETVPFLRLSESRKADMRLRNRHRNVLTNFYGRAKEPNRFEKENAVLVLCEQTKVRWHWPTGLAA